MKKILSLLLVTALMLSLMTMSAFADTADSDAKLVLKEGTLTIPDPVIPDPELPGVITGSGKDMDFGTRKVSVSDATYHAIVTGTAEGDQELPANYRPVGLMVADARGKDVASWNVKVKVSVFTSSVTSLESLKGFELNLVSDAASIKSNSTDPLHKPIASTPIVALVGGSATSTPIFESAVAGSPGKSGGNWQPNLVVKGGQGTVANHTATVTWTVEAV